MAKTERYPLTKPSFGCHTLVFSPVSNARLQYSHFHTFKFPARRSFLPSQSYDGGYDVTALLWRPRCALEQSTCKLKLTEHVELDCVLDAV